MDQHERFEILSIREMRRRYYRPNERAPEIRLDARRVPEPLRPLMSLAEKWGISDDILRRDAIGRATRDELDALRRIIEQYDHLLDEWLAGPEADETEFSMEYLAFSNMRMAADGC